MPSCLRLWTEQQPLLLWSGFHQLTGTSLKEVGSPCDLCGEERILVQYAFSASSPMPCDPSGHWSPRGAEGHPDVEQPCKPDVRTWTPNSAVIKQTVPPACPEPQGCYLELEFQYPVIPESLTIWVTYVSPEWDSKEAVNDIKLLMVSGQKYFAWASELLL